MDLDISIGPTPNPNALKFTLTQPVIAKGSATLKDPDETGPCHLGKMLFKLRGVDQLYFYDRTITVTKFSFEPWENLEPKVIETILVEYANHDIQFEIIDPESKRRSELSPELQQIEEILDRRIRPGLQGDGGDLQALSFSDNVLTIRYQGACGTCPSATMGTLEAIRAILQDEYDPEIEVYIAPEY